MEHTWSRAPLLLVAAGGLARETAVAARAAGRVVLGCLDDEPALRGTEVSPGLRVLGSVDEVIDHPEAALVLCAGKGSSRAGLAERLALRGVGDERYATVVHPATTVPGPEHPSAVGVGSILLAGVVLTADVTLGRHVVCMPNCVLTHDCSLEDFATVCAGVILGGAVSVGRAAYLGMSACVRESLAIGAGAVVGMGAVVLQDVPAHQTWAGAPARPLTV